MIRPRQPIVRVKPNQQLAQALEQQLQRRTPSIQQQAHAIQVEVEHLRKQTQELLRRYT